MSTGTVRRDLYGGYSSFGNVAGNSVTISGEAVVGDGTDWYGNIYGGWSNSGNAVNNAVEISSEAVVGDTYSYPYRNVYNCYDELIITIVMLRK